MKKISSISLLTAIAASGLALGAPAYTTPVGYVTKTLAPNQYNLVGLTLQNSSVSNGLVASSTSSSVTVTGSVNFTTLLTAGSTYILELPDGTVQEITSWSGNTLNTPEDISSQITNNVTSYKLRLSATVSSVFGANNSAGLTSSTTGDPSTVDNIIVYSSPGVSVSVYYFDLNSNGIKDSGDGDGWYTAGGEVADNLIIPYPDAVFVQRVGGTAKTLTISGEVKTLATKSVLGSGYNFISSVAPTGLTLLGSGLNSFLSTSSVGDPATVDNVIVDVGGVSVSTYFFDLNQNGVIDAADGDGWYTAAGEPADSLSLEGGFIITNLGAAKSYKLNVPSGFSSL